MSFSFYFIFRTKLEKAEAYGWEIHIHIRKHREGWLILMRTCVMDLLLHKEKRKKKKSHSSSQNHPCFSPEPLNRECYSHVRLNQSCIPGLKKLIFSNLSTPIDSDYSLTVVCPSCLSQHWGNSATFPRLFWGSPSCVFGREAAKGCSFSPAFLQLEEEGVFSPPFPFLIIPPVGRRWG